MLSRFRGRDGLPRSFPIQQPLVPISEAARNAIPVAYDAVCRSCQAKPSRWLFSDDNGIRASRMVNTQRTLVLVHGALHGAWCWQRVIPLIERHGILVRAVDLPSTSVDPPRGANLSVDAAA